MAVVARDCGEIEHLPLIPLVVVLPVQSNSAPNQPGPSSLILLAGFLPVSRLPAALVLPRGREAKSFRCRVQGRIHPLLDMVGVGPGGNAMQIHQAEGRLCPSCNTSFTTILLPLRTAHV
eukprot:130038-Hanusia_phi.AAC.2